MLNLNKRQFLIGTIYGGICSVFGASAWAQGNTHTVKMLSKSPDGSERQVFDPPVLRIEVGDSVTFVAADKGHNSTSNSDMLPAGAEPWKGNIGKDIEVNFAVSGVYGYHCVPHRSIGMVGLILVGDVSEAELEEAENVRQRGKARSRFETYFEAARAALG